MYHILCLLRFHLITLLYKGYQDSNEVAARTISFGLKLKFIPKIINSTEVFCFQKPLYMILLTFKKRKNIFMRFSSFIVVLFCFSIMLQHLNELPIRCIRVKYLDLLSLIKIALEERHYFVKKTTFGAMFLVCICASLYPI